MSLPALECTCLLPESLGSRSNEIMGSHTKKSILSFAFICFCGLGYCLGCTATRRNATLDEFDLYYDLGDITERVDEKFFKASFSIENDSDLELNLQTKRHSCSCVLIEDDNNFAKIKARESCQVRTRVSINNKFGDFLETITLEYGPQPKRKYNLHVRGFIKAPPRSVHPAIDIRYSASRPFSGSVKLVQQRSENQNELRLVSCSFVPDTSLPNDVELSLGSPIYDSQPIPGGVMSDTWEIPILFNSKSSYNNLFGKVAIRWSDESNSTIPVRINTKPRLEVLETPVYYSNIPGSQSVTSVQVRLEDPSLLSDLIARSNCNWCSAKWNKNKYEIDLIIEGREKGLHQCNIEIVEGGSVLGSFDLFFIAENR